MRTDGSKLWLLVGLSFAYGIFHAAGPGHGKAVISSYMLANEVALRRGILLSFISAFLQAFTAIAVMTLVFLVLRGTAISMTDATWFLEIASYALISCFGAWLLWKKAGPPLGRLFAGRRVHSLSAAAPSERHVHLHDDHAHHDHAHQHDGAHDHDHDHDDHTRDHADHGHLIMHSITPASPRLQRLPRRSWRCGHQWVPITTLMRTVTPTRTATTAMRTTTCTATIAVICMHPIRRC